MNLTDCVDVDKLGCMHEAELLWHANWGHCPIGLMSIPNGDWSPIIVIWIYDMFPFLANRLKYIMKYRGTVYGTITHTFLWDKV